jgi:hypothetical protein
VFRSVGLHLPRIDPKHDQITEILQLRNPLSLLCHFVSSRKFCRDDQKHTPFSSRTGCSHRGFNRHSRITFANDSTLGLRLDISSYTKSNISSFISTMNNMSSQHPTPRKLWQHPNPESTTMWKFMQRANKKHGLDMQVSSSNCSSVLGTPWCLILGFCCIKLVSWHWSILAAVAGSEETVASAV